MEKEKTEEELLLLGKEKNYCCWGRRRTDVVGEGEGCVAGATDNEGEKEVLSLFSLICCVFFFLFSLLLVMFVDTFFYSPLLFASSVCRNL